jgi:hypothetical protein
MTLVEFVTLVAGGVLGFGVVYRVMTPAPPPPASPAGRAAPPPPAASDAAAPHWSQVLEVARDAPLATVREAYKRQMSLYHPDKVASLGPDLRELAEEKSKAIAAAWQQAQAELGDPG